jgi:hypothetical protein
MNTKTPQAIVHVITSIATTKEREEMAMCYQDYIKVAVDIGKGILAGGGEWHADCEQTLLERGSAQDAIWGAGYNLKTRSVDFYSLINIRPRQGNPDQDILSPEIRQQVETIIRERLAP